MSVQLLDSIHEMLAASNDRWPREAWTAAEGHVGALEKRLARAVGSRDVKFCISSVNEGSEDFTSFTATLFTEDLVISGSLRATNERVASSRLVADVVTVPRSAIRSLTLHEVGDFGNARSEAIGHVSFTAIYEGMGPVHAGLPTSYTQREVASRLFDALQADLAKA